MTTPICVIFEMQSGKVSAKIEHNFEENQPSISQHMVCRPSTRNITGMNEWMNRWTSIN